ncbi:MAG: tetratricopeptide repeat protein, partial [Pseudomonadales bacterium]|nr:tetratricopeptide repeat protein [Pseudomonadales bacterium]
MQADTQNSAALKHRAAPLLLCLCITLFLSACQTSSHKPAPPAGEAVQTDIAATLAEVDQLVMQGQFEQALVLLQAGLAMQPESVDLAIRLGELYELLGDSRLARSTYEATLLREPGQVAVYENLGLLHLKSDRPELAERFLREALQLDETRIKAANTFATADSQSPLKAYNGLGILYSRRGQHEAAAEFFTTGLQIRPSALLYNNLGYARFLQGNTGGAEWAYLQALELVPGYRPAIRNLALLHGSKGHYGRAESLILEQGQKGAEWHDLHQIALLLGDATR